MLRRCALVDSPNNLVHTSSHSSNRHRWRHRHRRMRGRRYRRNDVWHSINSCPMDKQSEGVGNHRTTSTLHKNRIPTQRHHLSRIRARGLPDSKSTVSESSAGPTQVAPGLYAASLPGARTADKSFAVVSLCATGSAFRDFAQHREFFIIDDLGNVNPHLAEVVTEAVETIEEFRNEGFKVLVHCHGGRSRTGLILASWRKHTTGANPQPSCNWVEQVWPRVSWWNTDFTTWFHK